MTPTPFTFMMLPTLILALWAIYEALWQWRRRRGEGPLHTVGRLTGWALRPWAVWAAVNTCFRWQAARGNGFNTPRTFPFFADLWHEKLSFGASLRRLAGLPSVWIWSTVVVLLLVLLLAVLLCALRSEVPSRRTAWSSVGAMMLLAVCLDFSLACLPDGARLDEEYEGSLLSCWSAHATMLYAVPLIRSSRHYLRHFVDLQPDLRSTVHGLSHPPGASLSIYWIGRVMGVKGEDIRREHVQLRYAIGLTAFSALSIPLIYLLAAALFDDRRRGILAAALWLAAPSVLAYATFAQDGLYAVFFIASLLLTWTIATAAARPWCAMILQGVVFFALTMLNYSWCLMTTLFVVFTVAMARRDRRSLRELVWRTVIPLTLMTLLTGGLLLYYRLDYWAMYRCSSAYVARWYNYANAYQSLIALVGGQIDLFVLMGSVACSAFVTGLCRSFGLHPHPRTLFLWLTLTLVALPILFGPPCLRMETARCWNWATAVPFAFAAHTLLRQPSPRTCAVTAVSVSILTYTGIRLFVNFAP